MNTSFRFYWLMGALLLVGAGCASTVPLRTPLPREVAVTRFILDIEGLEADFPDKGGGLVPLASRIIQDAQDIADAARTIARPEGSPYMQVVDTVFAAFAQAAEAHLRLHVLPLDTLRGVVPYYVGVPFGDAGAVAQRGDFGGALEVEAYVTVPDAGEGSWSILGTGRTRVKGRPEMLMRVRLLNQDGAVVWRDQVRVRSKEKVELSEKWVLGFRTDRDVTDPLPTLPDLMREAVAKLARR